MSELYRNKYKITSNSLQSYDYSSEGAYFITICTAKYFLYAKIQKVQNEMLTESTTSKLSHNY